MEKKNRKCKGQKNLNITTDMSTDRQCMTNTNHGGNPDSE